MIPDFRLVVLVKLINLVTDALFLCLNAKIIKLEYIIFSLNIISEKLLAIFPMNTGFLDDFSNEVIGYYIGLIGVYFAVLIVVIQMYKGRRYLGEEISRSILFGSKNAVFSIIALTWILNIVFILFTFVFQAINLIPLVFLAFIAYFVYMAYLIAKYINLMILDDYKVNIQNNLINKTSKEDFLTLTKSIKFNNQDELEEILDFFIEKATDDKFIENNKTFVEVFYHLSENIFVDKTNIMIFLRKINEVDYTYISRTEYVNLKINHNKLAAFIKYNFNDENFDDYYEAVLKIIGNQIHLTCLGFDYSPKLFHKYFDAFINNNNLSDDNKYIVIRGLNFLRNEIAKSDDSEIRKIKYHIDYMRAIILLNLDDCIKEMSKVFCKENNGFMSYVIIMTCIILYIDNKKDYVKKYNEFLLEAIKNISVEKLGSYLQEIKEYIIHFENGISIFIKKVDKESDNRLQLATQYIFIEIYLNTGKISSADVRLFKELNNSNLINDLNEVAIFLDMDEVKDEELTEYERVIEKFEKNINKLVK
ncbi:unknown [Mycoplasma sp. CAG:956]|nr:unknown [Mycoplasma sp. CAG:956]